MSDVRVIEGDCLQVLPTLQEEFDAVITDPPYSSGGLFRGDRAADTASKYVQSESVDTGERAGKTNFSGDNRDQRSWEFWCVMWLTQARQVTRPGGYLLCFVDWRQLPTLTDAVQAAGWVWRGVAAWDKGESSRPPSCHHFRHQCEYIVVASNGPFTGEPTGPFPGCFRYPVLQKDKHHQAGKPTPLLRELVKVAPEGGCILDPFAGSGTTGVAAQMEGRHAVLVELMPEFAEVCRRRLAGLSPRPDATPSLFADTPA